MKEYKLSYRKRTDSNVSIHSSWYETCERQTKEKVISILKKHQYEPGEYILYFSANEGDIRRKKQQNFFNGWLTQTDDTKSEGMVNLGPVSFDYSDDEVKACDFAISSVKINCERELKDPKAKFIVAYEGLLPSKKEYEAICQRSYEQFINKLNKSVSFPIELLCEYPDVIFEIHFDTDLDEELAVNTLNVFEKCVGKYNKCHEEPIHDVLDVTDAVKETNANCVCIYIDFGNCNINALLYVIKALGKSNLPITKLILK
jgi:hypothetical protein